MKLRNLLTYFFCFMLWLLPRGLWAFPTQNDHSIGAQAMRFNKTSNFWWQWDLALMDGKIVSRPPNSTKYDRRGETFLTIGGDVMLGGRFALRLNFESEGAIARQGDDLEPISLIDERKGILRPSADLTFITQSGIEVFIGSQYHYYPKTKQTTTSQVISSTTEFSPANFSVTRIGLVKRGGVWSGGFSYEIGGSAKRSYLKTASDNSSAEGKDTVFYPSTASVFGNFKASVFNCDFEISSIQAGEGSYKTEEGNTIQEDYIRARLGGFYNLGGQGIKTVFGYKSLSYSDNAYMSLDTIPVTSVKLLWLLGDERSHNFFGIVYAQGKDGQSLPEFNADYDLKAYGVTLGTNLQL